MVIYSAAPRAAANFTARFEAALIEESGVQIQVQIVDRYAEALAALCDPAGSPLSVAWVDGLTYLAAAVQGCGDPVLIVQRGRGRSASTGETGVLIANTDRNFSTVAQVEGDTVCRLSYDDFWTWMAPSLVLQSHGVNPTTDLESITDYDDLDALIAAVAAGDCDAAGIPSSALENGEPPEGVSILETTIEFPYLILMFPAQIPLGARMQLTEALLTMAANSDTAETMAGLLDQDALLPVTPEDLTGFTVFLQGTGLDLTQLGG
jgi:ABC-type phosphate/phosphonate transport system substrate-binding protein